MPYRRGSQDDDVVEERSSAAVDLIRVLSQLLGVQSLDQGAAHHPGHRVAGQRATEIQNCKAFQSVTSA